MNNGARTDVGRTAAGPAAVDQSPRALAIPLRTFTDRGFDTTTVEKIAAEAGVSERTFFRYSTTKASMLWSEFETEMGTICSTLAAVRDDMSTMEAIRRAVVAANHHRAEDVPEMRLRMSLIATIPALSFSAAEHYEPWSRRSASSPDSGWAGPRSRLPTYGGAAGARCVPGCVQPLVGAGGHRPDRISGRGAVRLGGRVSCRTRLGSARSTD
jgi:AcrR family transcriptional regulator